MRQRQSPSAIVRSLLTTQRLGVLGTSGEAGPYASLVAFAASRDLKSIFFATARTTRKYGNLSRDPRVSLLVDSRSNSEADFRLAAAVTATGKATETKGTQKLKGVQTLLRKHPQLRSFVASSDCAILVIRVGAYYAVDQFREAR